MATDPTLPIESRGITIKDYVSFLAPCVVDCPRWPPDAFGIAAAVLHRSGAYATVVAKWPPMDPPADWAKQMRHIGEEWRQRWTRHQSAPAPVQAWWKTLADAGPQPLHALRSDPRVCEALLQICAAADEASFGVGMPDTAETLDEFDDHARERLTPDVHGSSLCGDIDCSKLIVLPRLHTPQTGITVRSISHNLALCPASEVCPIWTFAPRQPDVRSLNLLLFPWPEDVFPSHFSSADERCGALANMPPDRFGFFRYDSRRGEDLALLAQLAKAMHAATERVGTIDGVIMPELALAGLKQHEAVSRQVLDANAFLLCGINEQRDGLNYNTLAFDLPAKSVPICIRQQKHHRWCLDRRQVLQYGLGSRLDPMASWWENTVIEKREISFVAMKPWLTMAALICEDLARQDPVADIVRAVGPNLVLALLMDGPQLAGRWPARYATVLADDPGCSVLTITSLGMAKLSRPASGRSAGPVIALWKDAKGPGPIEIELPQGCHAAVLSLAADYFEEYSADGRSDGRATSYPVLAGIQYV